MESLATDTDWPSGCVVNSDSSRFCGPELPPDIDPDIDIDIKERAKQIAQM